MTSSDISQDTVKPSSYLETGDLETQEKVISLGEKLVSNFKQSEPDEVTTWMINYLAEQIELAEDGTCVQAKKNCFETILQLWENHSVFPDGARPFEQFESIFKTLDSLSPESAIPRYFTNQEFEPSEELDGSYKWLEGARKLDSTARTLISFMFDQAIDNAISDDTKDWIKTLSGTVDENMVNFIVRYAGEKEPNKTQERIEKLNNRVKQLKMFESLSKSIRQDLAIELVALMNEQD